MAAACDEELALSLLRSIVDELGRDGGELHREHGAELASVFAGLWLDTPDEDARLRAEARAAALSFLHTAVGGLCGAGDEVLLQGPDVYAGIWLLCCLRELQPDPADGPGFAAAELDGNLSQLLHRSIYESAASRNLRIGPAVADGDEGGAPRHLFLGCHALELAKAYMAELQDVLADEYCLHGGALALADLTFAAPGTRPAQTLGASVLDDLGLAAAIAHAATGNGGAKCLESDAPWLFEYARCAMELLLGTGGPDAVESVAIGLGILRGRYLPEFGEEDVVLRADAWLRECVLANGATGGAPLSSSAWERVKLTSNLLHAVRPRRAAASSVIGEALGRAAAGCFSESGLAEGSLHSRAPFADGWLGTPDGWCGELGQDGVEEQMPVVQTSAIGGSRGRGLFTVQPGRPVPLELVLDPAYGGGGLLTEEENASLWETGDDTVTDFLADISFGVFFRDEFSSGEHWGTLRLLSSALPQWLAEGTCAQAVNWDPEERYYVLADGEPHSYVILNSQLNPAAMANDALFRACTSEAEYNSRDRSSNNLVMVPCARPARGDPAKVEFSSVWVYPRRGWSWEQPQELTLGYGFEQPEEEEA